MGVAAFITAINISVYCIWVPSRLQISPVYEQVSTELAFLPTPHPPAPIWKSSPRFCSCHWTRQINAVWDRIEKCLYLIIDAALNFLFIRMVSSRLVE